MLCLLGQSWAGLVQLWYGMSGSVACAIFAVACCCNARKLMLAFVGGISVMLFSVLTVGACDS